MSLDSTEGWSETAWEVGVEPINPLNLIRLVPAKGRNTATEFPFRGMVRISFIEEIRDENHDSLL